MKKYLSIIMAFILAISLLPASIANAAPTELKVHFLDVGQGDSILIQAPGGKNLLVDGGTKASGDKVVSFLKEKGVKRLDYVVATHPDADHIGGLIAVLNSFPVSNFVNSGKVHITQTYAELLALVDSKNINYIEPENGDILIGNFTSDFYLQVLYADSSASESNDASIVIKTGYKKVEFLLMADADVGIEDYLMTRFDGLSVDVLKAGHHGSDMSSSAAFITKVKPKTAILSYGKNNSYGHPNLEVESRLQKVGAKVYKTALDCDITVTTDGVKHSVASACKDSKKEAVPAVTPTPEVKPESKPAPAPSTQTNFKNCSELRKVYPGGVKIGHPAYLKKHDRDGDGSACE